MEKNLQFLSNVNLLIHVLQIFLVFSSDKYASLKRFIYNIVKQAENIFFQGVVYQLDAALESAETQKHGLVFIYDMSDSKYQNFDYDLSQKILTLLKVS